MFLCGDADYYAAITVYWGGHITSTSQEICRFLSDSACEGEEMRMAYGNYGVCDSAYAVEWEARGNYSYVVWVRGRGFEVGERRDAVLHIGGGSSGAVLSYGVVMAAASLLIPCMVFW